MASSTTTATTPNSYTYNGNNEGNTNMCPDGHACDNDSTCVESLLHERKYVCDCYDAYQHTGRVYVGLSCQHVATAYCTLSGELSHTLFCANQGVCQSKVNPNQAHPGCQCPTGYTGAHCEYVTGSVPRETSYFMDGTTYAAVGGMYHNNNNRGDGGNGSPVNPAAIVMPIVAMAFLAVGLTLWKYRRMSLNHVTDKSKQPNDINMLEADGSASMAGHSTSSVLSSIGRRNSTPTFSSTHKAALMEPPDFEDLLEQSDHVHFHKDYTGSKTHKLFASDPSLQYTPTMETTGSGSPTSVGNDDDEENTFQDEDLTSPSGKFLQDVTSPTFERNHARYAAHYYDDSNNEEVFDEYNPKDFLPGNDPTFL